MLKKREPAEASPPPTEGDAITQYREIEEAITSLDREDTSLERKVHDAETDPDGADERHVRAWRRRREEIVGERRRRLEELHLLADVVRSEIQERERQALDARIAEEEEAMLAAQKEMFEAYLRLTDSWSSWRAGLLRLVDYGAAASASRVRLAADYDERRADASRASTVGQIQRFGSLP